MEREVWSREDLRNAILATYYAGVASQPAPGSAEAYWYAEGFRAALTALALHFGLPAVQPPARNLPSDVELPNRDDVQSRIIGDE